MTTDTPTGTAWEHLTDPAVAPTSPAPPWANRPLERPRDGRMIAGVAAAIAAYASLDVTVVRVVLAVLCVVGGIGVPLYLAGWLLIPEQGTDSSIAADLLHSTRGY